ncbi:unnamed protein product [Periconia digitata]|uniref:Uncharacterized protein n=1 Tax=Periconia digitata TaxID=1303443 RepID=A0A9W4XW95_9PLEO|nr:unnamed protein product [Periconia digitata]
MPSKLCGASSSALTVSMQTEAWGLSRSNQSGNDPVPNGMVTRRETASQTTNREAARRQQPIPSNLPVLLPFFVSRSFSPSDINHFGAICRYPDLSTDPISGLYKRKKKKT